MNTFDRMLEIVVTCHEAGVPLPMHPRCIVDLEDAGYIVDLHDGAIIEAFAPDVVAWPTPATVITAALYTVAAPVYQEDWCDDNTHG